LVKLSKASRVTLPEGVASAVQPWRGQASKNAAISVWVPW
jgi:hypothetical protein